MSTARPRRSAPVAVLDIVGLTPRLLPHMPHVRAVAQEGFTSSLTPVFPALTCPVQSTFLTGALPRDHGAVANGWFSRELGEVLNWRQSADLVTGERVWDELRRQRPDTTAANICWWYAMGAKTEFTVTPRPVYHYDGRKSPDCYTQPPVLHDELTRRLGTFPLFSYWGPNAGIKSSRWIAAAAGYLVHRAHPDLLLAYVPHLDYDLQRFGPHGPEAVAAARELDGVLAPLLSRLHAENYTVVILSEYGITQARRPVDINRALREEGLLRVYTQHGMEYLDPWASRAFALADHQVANIYVEDPADVPRVRDLLKSLPGVDEILDRAGQAALGADHERSGDMVAVAEPDAWFTYYYWLDDDRAPDFARGVEIFRKPGYDPAELFFDPSRRATKIRAAAKLGLMKAGIRSSLQVVPLDPTCVGGSHGRLPDSPEDGPLLICSDPSFRKDDFHATEVKNLLLHIAGVTPESN
ncbi:alkaline phosphatase family protein [Streptomyces sp. CC228A]|uniref:alkaline phosphatase family protein n=1 Tax=Streptomyces sp. CC228A TaxID=2898186 RepID=UPI001F1D1EA9|nr:nucleotide pyrophosphatase/phosphodiesterase family protein [Streptomyces sp. CC228A]